MFSALEDFLFKFFNMTVRADFLDWFLPLFESSLPVFLVAVISALSFAIYCKKTYGEFLYRFILFMAMIVLSAIFAKQAANSIYIERPRPYQEIAGTMFYDEQEKTWMQAQYAVDELYPPVTIEEENESTQQNSLDKEQIIDNVEKTKEENISGSFEEQEEVSSNEELQNNTQEIQENKEIIQEEKNNNISDVEQNIASKNEQPTFVIHGQAKLQPSSVIAISMAIAFVIALLVAKAMPYIYLFPLLIGWAQIYTGNAYLSD